MGALALSTADLRAFGPEPRVHDLRIGEVLGFQRPINVRKLVRRHHKEIRRHGELSFQSGNSISGKGRVMASEEFYLNEAQALVVCMHAQTPQAVEVRAQIINVFLAYRHGKLTATMPMTSESPERAEPWRKMEERIRQLEKMMGIQGKVESPEYARALAYAPTILFLENANGKRRRQARPKWWYNLAIREAVIETHRQMTIAEACLVIRHRFPKAAALPSKSSIHRFWQTLDAVRAAS